MSENILDYLKEKRNKNESELYDFLKIQSESTDAESRYDVHRAGESGSNYVERTGYTNLEGIETKGHPIIYAEYMEAGIDAPTVLLYGHYDVQPADPYEEWLSDPFNPEERNNRIYARGASDDKGQVFMHLAVFEAFMKTEGRI